MIQKSASRMSACVSCSRTTSIEAVVMLLKDKTNKLINSDPKHLRRSQVVRAPIQTKMRPKSVRPRSRSPIRVLGKSPPRKSSNSPSNCSSNDSSNRSSPAQMDVNPLTMSDVKTATSFSVKDLLDLQESGICGSGLTPGLGCCDAERSGLLAPSHQHLIHGQNLTQHSSAPELGEIIASGNPDGCRTDTTSMTSSFYDQDNPYTRWLQNNENMHYTGE